MIAGFRESGIPQADIDKVKAIAVANIPFLRSSLERLDPERQGDHSSCSWREQP
jgi:hypothetical protein